MTVLLIAKRIRMIMAMKKTEQRIPPGKPRVFGKHLQTFCNFANFCERYLIPIRRDVSGNFVSLFNSLRYFIHYYFPIDGVDN